MHWTQVLGGFIMFFGVVIFIYWIITLIQRFFKLRKERKKK